MKAATVILLVLRYIQWISIHAAREGGDDTAHIPKLHQTAFQSTPPVKAATKWGVKSQAGFDISIHAAREGGDGDRSFWDDCAHISIHAAREGGDR